MYRFSADLGGSLDIARTYATHHKHPYLSALHLVYGLAKNPNLSAHAHLSQKLSEIEESLSKTPQLSEESFDPGKLAPDQSLISWLQESNALATEQGSEEISERHLLACVPGKIKRFFKGLDTENIISEKEEERPNFLVDLNERAAAGKIDPVIGREREIRNLLEVLGRRSKNNPILLGEAGVGKTAVVEGLANLIVRGDVPEQFQDTTLYSLDLAALMAGTKFRGEFEERLQKLLKFAQSQHGKALIFFDEIHTLMGAGKTEGGASDGANLLKPALARGDLKCIGATTHNEYQKYIMSDSALDRRFRPIIIREPSVEASLEILLGLKDRFEAHHGLSISQEALHSAVFLSERYIQHRHLPDKAIDLIDEACSAKKFAVESMPSELIALESELRAKRTLSQTEKRDAHLMQQIEELEKVCQEKKARWEQEVKQLREFAALKKIIDQRMFDQSNAEKEGNFEEASRLKFSEIPSLEKRLASYKVSTSLEKEDIADVLSRQTGIPKEKILASKQERILKLEEFLNTKVFAQKEVLHEIAETLISSYAGLGDETRPLGSFLLKGPSGVGKTETAKALSEFFFEHADQVIRVDLSEYSEKHSIAKLIGAPSGYVGYDEGGQLTEAVRKKPYSIILFDELEKAHPDFADLLLQILDDGRLTDNKGRTISFRNTCILLTTNSQNIEADFKPEVLGRLDGVLTYNSLNPEAMKLLVQRELDLLNQSLLSKNITVSLSQDFKDLICSGGYHPQYGARPLKSFFRKKVVRPMAHKVLRGGALEGNYHLSLDSGELVIQHEESRV